ncbi:hypothetical protein F2Q70_00030504 [Brassica cretica]|uniref:Uncharacterized protein n=1 Tax=Brassica cretica TaxID=69181 RepID=A0A8S9FMH7_BRACR|nr:hypothetical protein F2Q70_00030504 [Brassica cretica]
MPSVYVTSLPYPAPASIVFLDFSARLPCPAASPRAESSSESSSRGATSRPRCATSRPRCARPLQIILVSRRNAERVDDVAARGRSRFERVAYLAPVGRSSSSTRPMIIFYFCLNHNALKHLQSLHSTLQHLIRTMHAIWTLKMPNS